MTLLTFDVNNFTKEEYDYWYNLLSEEKKQRVDRVKIERNKKCTVAGEMLARKLIAEFFNISYKEMYFSKTSYGKPFIKNYNIYFNISHSHNMVICGINENEIGVDIEKIRPIDLKIAKRVCLNTELKYVFGETMSDFNGNIDMDKFNNLCTKTDSDTINRFFEIWTAKEAYFKCIGTGIADFKSVDTLNNPMIDKPIYKNGFIIRTATKK